jgi:hypothetical protein
MLAILGQDSIPGHLTPILQQSSGRSADEAAKQAMGGVAVFVLVTNLA